MTGVGALLHHRLRRDRWQLLMWIGGTALLAASAFAGVQSSFGTLAHREALLATVMVNPVILLFRGLPSGADEGAFLVFLILPFLAMAAAFMSSFLAVRHTRGEEESGRGDLIAATPAGRTAPLIATLIEGLAANVLLATLVAAVFVGSGEAIGGAVLVGLATASVGVVFLGVALLAAQLVQTARAANAIGVWTIMIGYLVAGLGNAIGTPSADLARIESAPLAWLSPFGWAEHTRPFADDSPAPLLLSFTAAVVVTGVAGAIAVRRDVGASALAGRRGPAEASRLLSTHTGLLWRLTWPAIAGWAAGGLIIGILATKMASVLAGVARDLPAVQQILHAVAQQGSLTQGSIVIFFTMLGVLAGCCAVQLVCRARQDEVRGFAEATLATPISRVRWLSGYLLVAAVGIIAIIGAGIIGAALGLASVDAAPAELMMDAVVTGAGQAGAAAVFLALSALVFVLAPRATMTLSWSLVILGLVVGLFGPLFAFPDALIHVSPFAATPVPSGGDVDLRGLWWVALVTVGGTAAALLLMRRRELAGP